MSADSNTPSASSASAPNASTSGIISKGTYIPSPSEVCKGAIGYEYRSTIWVVFEGNRFPFVALGALYYHLKRFKGGLESRVLSSMTTVIWAENLGVLCKVSFSAITRDAVISLRDHSGGLVFGTEYYTTVYTLDTQALEVLSDFIETYLP